jgi:hypothetical protein
MRKTKHYYFRIAEITNKTLLSQLKTNLLLPHLVLPVEGLFVYTLYFSEIFYIKHIHTHMSCNILAYDSLKQRSAYQQIKSFQKIQILWVNRTQVRNISRVLSSEETHLLCITRSTHIKQVLMHVYLKRNSH